MTEAILAIKHWSNWSGGAPGKTRSLRAATTVRDPLPTVARIGSSNSRRISRIRERPFSLPNSKFQLSLLFER